MYLIRFSSQAEKDKKNIKVSGLEKKTRILLDIIRMNPYQTPPPYEALVGNLNGFFSRRINIQHRLVYSIHPGEVRYQDEAYEGEIWIARMWTHYDGL